MHVVLYFALQNVLVVFLCHIVNNCSRLLSTEHAIVFKVENSDGKLDRTERLKLERSSKVYAHCCANTISLLNWLD